eukprot:s1331_g3.t1
MLFARLVSQGVLDSGSNSSGNQNPFNLRQHVWTSSGYTRATLKFLEVATHFVVKGQVRSVGGPNSVDNGIRTRCLSRMLAWRALAEEVVRAEHPSFELVQCYSAFDMQAFERDVSSTSALDLQCSEPLSRVASALDLDLEELISEYLDLGSIALAFWKKQKQTCSNLECWQHAINATSNSAARRRHPISSLSVALANYACMTASDSVIERDFSRFKHILGEKRLQCHVLVENDLLSLAVSDASLDSEIIARAQRVWRDVDGVCSRQRTKKRFDKGIVKLCRGRSAEMIVDDECDDDAEADDRLLSEAMFRRKRRKGVTKGIDAGVAASDLVPADASDAWTEKHQKELQFNADKQLKRAFEGLKSGTLSVTELPAALIPEAVKYFEKVHSNMVERERAENRLAKRALQKLPSSKEKCDVKTQLWPAAPQQAAKQQAAAPEQAAAGVQAPWRSPMGAQQPKTPPKGPGVGPGVGPGSKGLPPPPPKPAAGSTGRGHRHNASQKAREENQTIAAVEKLRVFQFNAAQRQGQLEAELQQQQQRHQAQLQQQMQQQMQQRQCRRQVCSTNKPRWYKHNNTNRRLQRQSINTNRPSQRQSRLELTKPFQRRRHLKKRDVVSNIFLSRYLFLQEARVEMAEAIKVAEALCFFLFVWLALGIDMLCSFFDL